MPAEQIAWKLVGIILILIVMAIIIIFSINASGFLSTSAFQPINAFIDKYLSIGSGWFRIGLPHVGQN